MASTSDVSNGQFEFHWPDHSDNLLNVFGSLLCNETMVDVTLACQDGTLKCHQMVLAGCSPYFQSLFKSNPCQHPIVFLHNCVLAEIKVIVDFMYQGVIKCPFDILFNVMETARNLQVQGMDSAVTSKLYPTVSNSTTLPSLTVDTKSRSGSHRGRGRPRKDKSKDGEVLTDISPTVTPTGFGTSMFNMPPFLSSSVFNSNLEGSKIFESPSLTTFGSPSLIAAPNLASLNATNFPGLGALASLSSVST